MKTRKLLAMLVAVAMIVTMLPVVAFADGDPEKTAVADASRIYASDDEVDADGEDEVTITVYLRDASGDPASLASGEYLYIWAERTTGRVSTIDTPKNVDSVDGTSMVRFATATDDDDKVTVVTVKYTSKFEGDARFWFAITDIEYPDPAAGVKVKDILDEKAGYVDVEFKEVEKYTLTYRKLESEPVPANGIDYQEIEITVLDKHNLPVPGEKVNFDTSSSRMVLNKDSAVTNSNGVVKVKATSERAGTYTLYAQLDADRKVKLNDGDGVPITFGASAAYDIKVKKGDGALVALDQPYTFEFVVYDLFGRVIKGTDDDDTFDNYVLKYIEKIEVPTCPDKAAIDKSAPYVDADKGDAGYVDSSVVKWASNGNLKVNIPGDDLNKEGEYALRVKLQSGKYATANFKVTEQGEIVDMTIEYDPDYVEEGKKSVAPKVKIIDADGVEANAADKDLEFSVSNTRLATIDEKGILTAKEDVDGVVTVTVVNTKHNIVATTEVRIGDVGAAGIEFDVPETLLVGEEYTIGMTVVDEDGKEYMDEPDFNAVVLSKPAGAKVEVDVYDDELEIYSDTKGEVKLIVTARDDETNEAVSSTLTLNFVTEPVKPAAGKVVLTIGANFGLVDGAVTELDAPAFIAEGRTFVPVRFIAEALGAEADWEPKDAAVETVFLTWDDMEIIIGIGDEFLTVTKDGEAEVFEFDGAARIVNGRTFLPFRAIGEAFGVTVDYGPKDGPVEWVSFE